VPAASFCDAQLCTSSAAHSSRSQSRTVSPPPLRSLIVTRTHSSSLAVTHSHLPVRVDTHRALRPLLEPLQQHPPCLPPPGASPGCTRGRWGRQCASWLSRLARGQSAATLEVKTQRKWLPGMRAIHSFLAGTKQGNMWLSARCRLLDRCRCRPGRAPFHSVTASLGHCAPPGLTPSRSHCVNSLLSWQSPRSASFPTSGATAGSRASPAIRSTATPSNATTRALVVAL